MSLEESPSGAAYESLGADDSVLTFRKSEQKRGTMGRGNRSHLILIWIVGLCIGVGVGVLIGWFSSQAKFPDEEAYNLWRQALTEEDAQKISKLLIDELKADNIKENLRYLTSRPHLAGTPADKENAEWVKDRWIEQGLDSANVIPYKVLLSYPNVDKPNYVYILNGNGSVYFQSAREEAPLKQGDLKEGTVPPFNAYSANGTVTGELVYVNYGRIEDFQKLTGELNIDLTGKIAIARYGKIFRGDKAEEAAAFGAVGLILFSDPADYAVESDLGVYPDTWYLPETGVQRGSLYSYQSVGGDPLSPGYPSYETAYKTSEDAAGLPTIPVQPIGYGDAKMILEQLAGPKAPDEWQGNIHNLTYNLGPGYVGGRTVKLEVNTHNEERFTYNTIGIIRGSIEPDRYIIAGNHRDAWVYGAVDPSSGTAALMEMSRAMGKLVKDGKWRPRRSIVFASWAAEEYSLIGSTEWVEEFTKNLGSRTVAYLNIDISVEGNYTFRLKSTPNLYEAVFSATKNVPDVPFPGHSSTVYDTWLDRTGKGGDRPSVRNIGSGSDYASFLGEIGVPSVDLRYTFNSDLGLSSYPLYHSMYETFFLVSEIMDHSFEYHLAVTRVWAELARSLADSLILPIGVVDTAEKITGSIATLKDFYEDQMAEQGITWDTIESASSNLTTAAKAFESNVADMEKNDPFAVRRVNDQLMQFERAFIDPLGLPGRNLQRHVVFAPSSKDAYKGDAFPGIVDLMFDINNPEGDVSDDWEALKQHMSVVAFTLQSAASTLKDVDILHRD
ncbi:N-acetylated-alpha-linked acidic dipeptidase 2 isoform X2 [Strongylocentrotus purpuratus]|uniref:glutamate carboxypeptidase II n=1 Tax=Strongylocentrotus purpuratus TaxID=7668 RepID=A0A7M7PQU9_STRPU|nr:N-acetylated-alpha-linked acidic dipeptidase 2 isoform X2 [Strongylocentrotus purpuratus]